MSKQLFLLDLVLIFCVLALVSAQVAFNVNATYRSFNSPTTKQGIGNKWNLNTSGVLCASQDGNKSLSWRSKYGWAAFCGVWLSKHACGKCLNVTNKDSESTLAQVRFPITQTVRIVDNCSHGGLDLDMDVFQKLDTSGYGMSQGYLVVDYEFVDCVSGTLAAAPDLSLSHCFNSSLLHSECRFFFPRHQRCFSATPTFAGTKHAVATLQHLFAVGNPPLPPCTLS